MTKIKVRPTKDGMNLKHQPDGQDLPDEGGEWPADNFTFARLRDGDIERVEDERKPEAAPAPAGKVNPPRAAKEH